MSSLDNMSKIGGAAAIGSSMGPIGAIAGAGLAIGQLLMANSQQNKADASLPNVVDPEQVAMQRYYERMKNAYNTGTANASARADLQQTTKQALAQAFKFGGASTDLSSIKNIYLSGMGQLNQQSQEQSMKYAQLQQGLTDEIAQKKLEIGMQQYATKQGRATSLMDAGYKNLGAVLTSFAPQPDDITSTPNTTPKANNGLSTNVPSDVANVAKTVAPFFSKLTSF